MRTYNDPVHGRQVILSEVGAAFLDHPALLQLRGKKQLAMKDRLFANATHNRYLHSIGTMITANKIALNLGLSDEQRKLLEVAAALHDIGHYPFSHATERVRGMHHEEIPQQVLREKKNFGAINAQALHKTLGDLDVDPIAVADILAEKHELSALISHKVVDVDRLDYLARDFLACGVSFGADTDRVLQTLTFDDGILGVSRSGVVSVTSFLVARSLAYDQIYQHRRIEVAETMLQFAVLNDPSLAEKSAENDERVHTMSDYELLAHLEKSTSPVTKDLAMRLRGGVSDWYIPVWEIGGESELDQALVLFSQKEALEKELMKNGFLWSWNTTHKFAKNREPPKFPVSDGSDLFDRKIARAAWDYVPERLLSIYGPTGSEQEKQDAQLIVNDYLK